MVDLSQRQRIDALAYWLLATRAACRVLWSRWRTGRYEPAKVDRVTARHFPLPSGERAG